MQIYMVDMGDRTVYWDRFDLWRWWDDHKAVIDQDFASWMHDMQKRGLVIPVK